MRRFLPGGLGGGRGVALIALAVVALWLLTGFYRVDAGSQGVELLFGRWNGTTRGPGLHYWFPSPIGSVDTPNVETVRTTSIGFRGGGGGGGDTRAAARRDVPQESLMLTSDQNIADLDFTVQWKISDAGMYLFNIRDPEQTVKLVAESAMREVVGRTNLEPLITAGRQLVADQTEGKMQEVLDDYGAGISVQGVVMEAAEAPAPVIDAFNEVQRARQDRERVQNEADAYANRVVPTARGEAAKMVEEANAYKEAITKKAEGEAARFIEVYEAYRTAEEVTRRRMFLETMTQVLGNANKIVIDPAAQGTSGVVPYLPLNELNRPRTTGGQGGQ